MTHALNGTSGTPLPLATEQAQEEGELGLARCFALPPNSVCVDTEAVQTTHSRAGSVSCGDRDGGAADASIWSEITTDQNQASPPLAVAALPVTSACGEGRDGITTITEAVANAKAGKRATPTDGKACRGKVGELTPGNQASMAGTASLGKGEGIRGSKGKVTPSVGDTTSSGAKLVQLSRGKVNATVISNTPKEITDVKTTTTAVPAIDATEGALVVAEAAEATSPGTLDRLKERMKESRRSQQWGSPIKNLASVSTSAASSPGRALNEPCGNLEMDTTASPLIKPCYPNIPSHPITRHHPSLPPPQSPSTLWPTSPLT